MISVARGSTLRRSLIAARPGGGAGGSRGARERERLTIVMRSCNHDANARKVGCDRGKQSRMTQPWPMCRSGAQARHREHYCCRPNDEN